jgi:exopolysaccharide biosynthesis polyprenyl glycosylphosphotransferase
MNKLLSSQAENEINLNMTYVPVNNPAEDQLDSVHPSVYSLGKRLIDLLGAIIGLIIIAILFIPFAIAIKLDSEGPIFYRQTRCGLQGKKFTIWKFRSMCVDADTKKHLVKNKAKGHIFKNDQDPRITNVGKFLRRTSLDEFPQFWNVLTGEMSLVGTRPPTPTEVAQYNERHKLRLRVKPGITGEWQVKGRSKINDFDEVVSLDLDYQAKWSVWYDLLLILKTIKVVIKREGAF